MVGLVVWRVSWREIVLAGGEERGRKALVSVVLYQY
jgi:hypothetical protein